MSRVEEILKKAEEIEREISAVDNAATLDEMDASKPESDLPADQGSQQPEKKVEVTPDPVAVDPKENQIKEAVRAMNEAQRKAADERKMREAEVERVKELERRINELAEAQKKPLVALSEPEPEDELERELVDVTVIAKRQAARTAASLREEFNREIAEIKKNQAEWTKMQEQVRQEAETIAIWGEVQKAHPDALELARSEAMASWIENDAPPIYKQIYNGSVKATSKDIVQVISHFKSTMVPAKIEADIPTDRAVATRTPTQPVTNSLESMPLSENEIRKFRLNWHKKSDKDRALFYKRMEAMT